MSKRIFLFIGLLFMAIFADSASAINFNIEPVKADADFLVLGYANGNFIKKGKKACFKVKNVKLVLNKKNEYYPGIIGFKFGIAYPVKDAYDYLAQTDLFQINRTLSKEQPMYFHGIELCLNLPPEANWKISSRMTGVFKMADQSVTH